jgi:hypothetical protein
VTDPEAEAEGVPDPEPRAGRDAVRPPRAGERDQAIPSGGRPALAAVAVLAVFSAFWRIGRSDWKLDEDAYAQAGWYLVHDGVDPNHGHPPLAKLLFGGAQVLFGRDVSSVRTVAALAFLASTAVVFLLGRRIGGWWTGVAAAGAFAALPRTMVVGGWEVADIRIERYALLESVAAPLILGATYAGWRWISGDGRRWALVAGLLAGLAGASKLNSILIVVPIVGVALAFRWGRPRLAAEGGALVGVAVAAFLAPFAVFGRHAATKVHEVLWFPVERSREGHLLVLGRSVYDRSPWWANLKYVWDADGPLLVAAVALGLGAALLSRRRAPVVYLLLVAGALVVPAQASPVALPHYRASWTGLGVVLVAVGLVELLTTRDGGPARQVARAVAGLAAAVLVVSGIAATVRLAALPEGDYRTMARAAAADGVRPTKVLVYGEAVAPYFPGAYDSLAPFDDGTTPAQLVVLDPSLTDAVGTATVEEWRARARGWGLVPHHIGRLEAWWAAP